MKIGFSKYLLSIPVGGGSIFVTMQLTNQADTGISVGELKLENAPEIKEELIDPTKAPPPPPPPPAPTPSSGSKGESNGGTPSAGATGGSGSQGGQQSSGSSSAPEGAMDTRTALKWRLTNISSKSTSWLRTAGTFSSSYEVLDNVNGVASLLEALKKELDQEAKQQGASGSSSGATT